MRKGENDGYGGGTTIKESKSTLFLCWRCCCGDAIQIGKTELDRETTGSDEISSKERIKRKLQHWEWEQGTPQHKTMALTRKANCKCDGGR